MFAQPTNPKKLVEQLTKIETKLGSATAHVPKNNDRRKQSESQLDNPHTHNRSQSQQKRAKAGSNSSHTKATDHRIPMKEPFPTRTEKICKPYAEYRGSSNTHKTMVRKKWLPSGKTHPEWKGGKNPAHINVHQGKTVNQLMAQ